MNKEIGVENPQGQTKNGGEIDVSDILGEIEDEEIDVRDILDELEDNEGETYVPDEGHTMQDPPPQPNIERLPNKTKGGILGRFFGWLFPSKEPSAGDLKNKEKGDNISTTAPSKTPKPLESERQSVSGNNTAEAKANDNVEKTDGNEQQEQPEAEDTEDKELDELRDEYIEDIKDNSEFPETIVDDGEPYEKISPEENAKMREEFKEKREKLIKEWEEKNGKEWPRYEKDVYDKNGNIIRRAGDRYDAHHIRPLSWGGKNTADNITPISAEKHHDKQGIHAPGSPYAKITNHLEGGKKNEA
jgi:hypothetical protein